MADPSEECLKSPSAFWLRMVASAGADPGHTCCPRFGADHDAGRGRSLTAWFGDAGYLVHRWRDRSASGLFLFDVGELGFRNNPGHGHADHLSVILQIGGQPILVDPGTLRYGENPAFLWFKSARAHNTLCFPGHEPADLWRYFRWCDLPSRPESSHRDTANGLQARGVFRGYLRRLGAVHSRSVFLESARGLVIRDDIECRPQESTGELSFHFHPRASLRRFGDASCELEIGGLKLPVVFDFGIESMRLELSREPVASRYGCCATGPVVRVRPDSAVTRWSVTTNLTWPAATPTL